MRAASPNGFEVASLIYLGALAPIAFGYALLLLSGEAGVLLVVGPGAGL